MIPVPLRDASLMADEQRKSHDDKHDGRDDARYDAHEARMRSVMEPSGCLCSALVLDISEVPPQ